MEGSILWLACVDAWVATLVKCLTKWEMRRVQVQELYADTQGILLEQQWCSWL